MSAARPGGARARWLLLCLAVAACPAAAQAIMEPGAWELHTVMTAQDPEDGKPVTLGETTRRNCLTREFLARDLYLSPASDEQKMRERGAKCTVSEVKRSDFSASWRMACELADGSRLDMAIRNTVSRHELLSELKQLVSREGRDIPMQIVAKARFVGACGVEGAGK